MSSIKDIKEGIETDIKLWEEALKKQGYKEEDIKNLLSKLSPETVESIKNDPDKMAEIIEKLIKKGYDGKDHIQLDSNKKKDFTKII